MTTIPSPDGPRRMATKYSAVVAVVIALGLVFLLLLHSLAIPLMFAAIAAVLVHPLQERLTRRLRGHGWLAAGGLTLAFALAVALPPALAVSVAYDDLARMLRGVTPGEPGAGPLSEDSPRLRPLIAWVGANTGAGEERVRGWVRDGGADLEQVFYHRSLRVLGDLPGFALGTGVFFLALFFFLKDGPQMVAAWEDITPLDNRHERLIHGEFARVCRGLIWSSLAAAAVQAVAFGVGLFVIDLAAGSGLGRWVVLLSLLTAVCSPIPFVGSAVVWLPTAGVLVAQGHPTAGAILAIYGAAFVAQIDTVIRVWVLKGVVRLHPLLVFVSVLGGVQVLGVLGLIVGPVTAAVLFALLRVLRAEGSAVPPPLSP